MIGPSNNSDSLDVWKDSIDVWVRVRSTLRAYTWVVCYYLIGIPKQYKIYQSTGCSTEPPWPKELRGPPLEVASGLSSISGGFLPRGLEAERFRSKRLWSESLRSERLQCKNSCAGAKRPGPGRCQAWHEGGPRTRRRGIEADLRRRGRMYACSVQLRLNCHLPYGRAGSLVDDESFACPHDIGTLQMEREIWMTL